MLPTSSSTPSGLGSKRRLSDFDDDLEIYTRVMNMLWADEAIKSRFSGTNGHKEWKQLTKRTLKKNFPKISKPFTEGGAFYQEVFSSTDGQLDVKEIEMDNGTTLEDPREPVLVDKYQQAADALIKNPLWVRVKKHVLVKNETGCRTVIDMVVLAAIDIAQQELSSDPTLDNEVCERYEFQRPERPKRCLPSDKLRSWILMNQEVTIPDQDLKAGLAFHGIPDYMVSVVNAAKVHPFPTRFLRALEAGVYSSDTVKGHGVASIMEAKSHSTMDSSDARAQVLVQGAALCVYTKRRTVVNVLTDGTMWKFHTVSKTPDEELNEGDKPFQASETCALDVLHPGHLAIVIRLLTAAILFPAEDFKSFATTCGRKTQNLTSDIVIV
ncbi:hypothetical protein DFH09DRAFT_266625 [Mycena vulgaris]|nr:hypothetical protein DFH09DRAFT_266625 [Mycena vulgaris]